MISNNPQPGDIYYQLARNFKNIPYLRTLKFIKESEYIRVGMPYPKSGYTVYQFESSDGEKISVYSHHHNSDFYYNKSDAIAHAKLAIEKMKSYVDSMVLDCEKSLVDINTLAVYPFEI